MSTNGRGIVGASFVVSAAVVMVWGGVAVARQGSPETGAPSGARPAPVVGTAPVEEFEVQGAFLDFGDAPDGIAACGIAGGVGFFPTVFGTVNAAPGRTSPFHFPPIVGPNILLGGAISYEFPAWQPPCDWFTPGCDETTGPIPSDDAPLVLCLTPGCTSGVTLSAATCVNGIGIGSCFGPSPGVAPLGYWVFSTTQGVPPAPATFINVVADWNLSGSYGDAATEWCLMDKVPAGVPGFPELHVTLPFPVLTVAKLPFGRWAIGPFWTRFHVSEEAKLPVFPSPPDWEGSGPPGGLMIGETEDWVPLCDPGSNFRCKPPTYCFRSIGRVAISPLSDPNCLGSTVVQLSSVGLPLASVREFRLKGYVNGQSVALVMDTFTLRGIDPGLGQVVVRQHPNQMSWGMLRHVQAPGGVLIQAQSFFDVFVHVDLPNLGLTLENRRPIRMNLPNLLQLPPVGQSYLMDNSQGPIPLHDVVTGQPIAFLCFAEHTPTVDVPWACMGDADGNKVVNFGDVLAVLANFLSGGPIGDANMDCFVDFNDVLEVLANFLVVCPTQ